MSVWKITVHVPGALVLLCACLLVAVSIFGAELPDNLLKNGDFSTQKTGWQTDGRVVEVEKPGDNPALPRKTPALKVELNKSKDKEISQKVRAKKNVRVLKVSFRVKPEEGFLSSSPSSGAIKLRFKRPDGSSTFSDRKVQPSKGWQEVAWTFDQIRGANDLEFEVTIKAGEGSLLFDDFVITPLEG